MTEGSLTCANRPAAPSDLDNGKCDERSPRDAGQLAHYMLSV